MTPGKPDGELLKVTGLACAYAGTIAVRDVSLTVAAGEIVVLLGANGAGKSTTAKSIAGVHPPLRGSILFDGHQIASAPSHVVVRRGVTLVPEGRLVFPQLTVRENLLLGAYTARSPARVKALVEEAFATFPRLEQRRSQLAGLMSGGEQQMLAIARGLMPTMTQELFRLIQDINRRGVAILLVEQNLHQALSIAQRGYVLEKGSVVLSGTSAELLSNDYVQQAFLGR